MTPGLLILPALTWALFAGENPSEKPPAPDSAAPAIEGPLAEDEAPLPDGSEPEPASDSTTSADPATAEDRARARRLRDAAFQRLGAEDYAGGIELLEAAYDLVPNPGLLLNIVIAYRQWPEHCEEAYATYRRFEAACGSDCAFRRSGAEQLAAVDAKCEAPVTLVAPGSVPAFVDATFIGHTPQTLRLRPGVHRVQTSTSGSVFEIDVVAETPQVVMLAAAADLGPERVRTRDAFTFGLAGLAASAAIVGATFTGLAVDAGSTLDGARGAGVGAGELDRLAERQSTNEAVAAVGWSVAAASGVAAMVLWLTRDPPARLSTGAAPRSGADPSARLPSRPSSPGALELGLGSLRVRF